MHKKLKYVTPDKFASPLEIAVHDLIERSPKLGESYPDFLSIVTARDPSLANRHWNWRECLAGRVTLDQIENADDREKLRFLVKLTENLAAKAERDMLKRGLALHKNRQKFGHASAEIMANTTTQKTTFARKGKAPMASSEWGFTESGVPFTQLTLLMEKNQGPFTPTELIADYPELADHHLRIMNALISGDPSDLTPEEAGYWTVLQDKGELAAEVGDVEDLDRTKHAMRLASEMALGEIVDKLTDPQTAEPERQRYSVQLTKNPSLVEKFSEITIKKTGFRAEAVEGEYLPAGGSQSFVEYDDWLEAQEVGDEIYQLRDIWQGLTSNVLEDLELSGEAKTSAILQISNDFISRLGERKN